VRFEARPSSRWKHSTWIVRHRSSSASIRRKLRSKYGNRIGAESSRCSKPIQSANFQEVLGRKLMQGDHQAPEGFYDITPDQMNPNSSEYLAFNTGFPNAFDRSLGRTGSFLMVHGGCRSVGCYAMTDYAMDEIYGLVDEAFKGGQEKVQLQAFPFRMTAQHLASHAGDPNLPFWEMLKAGSDAFLATEQPPRVAVCDRRYVFNSVLTGEFNPSAPCPIGIDSTPIAGVLQPSREISASTSAVPPNTRTVAYRTADPIARKIQESLRGIY
jgi:murein L,D-transpeptidase YafK